MSGYSEAVYRLELRMIDRISALRRDIFKEIELLRTSIRTLSDEIEESNSKMQKADLENRLNDLSETVNQINELRFR